MRKYLKTTKGAGLVDFGILVGLIAVLAISAVLGLGTTVRTGFDDVSQALSQNGLTGNSVVQGADVPVVAAFGEVPSVDAISTVIFESGVLPTVSGVWVGFSSIISIQSGTNIVVSGTPEITGMFYHYLQQELQIAFSALSSADIAQLRFVCETEADGIFYDRPLSEYTVAGAISGNPSLMYVNTNMDQLSFGLGAHINPVPIYCELRPI